MKAIKKILILFMLVSAFAISCDPSDDPSGPPTDTYIPDLSTPPGNWGNVADDTDIFFFLNTPPAGSASGTFDGNRNRPSGTEHFTGSFNHSSITMVFDDSPTRTYTGTINGSTNPVTMTLSTPAVGAEPAINFTLKKL